MHLYISRDLFTTPYTTKMSKYKYHIDQYMFFLPNELYTFAKKKKKKIAFKELFYTLFAVFRSGNFIRTMFYML